MANTSAATGAVPASILYKPVTITPMTKI